MLFTKREVEMRDKITEGMKNMSTSDDARKLVSEIEAMIEEAEPDFAEMLKIQKDFIESQEEMYQFLESLR